MDAAHGRGYAVLADLDGVLIDSAAHQRRAWEWWAADVGLDPGPFLTAHGWTGRDKIARWSHLNPTAEVARIVQHELEDLAGVVALPGAAELLASDRRVGIVTSCTRALALARLEAAGLQPRDVLVTAESVIVGKPAPGPYLHGAELIEMAPRRCVVIEDAPDGVRSGIRAGMRVIAVTTTVGPAELREAHVVLPDLAAYLRL